MQKQKSFNNSLTKNMRWHIGKDSNGMFCIYRWVYGNTVQLTPSFKTKKVCKVYANYFELNVISEVI